VPEIEEAMTDCPSSRFIDEALANQTPNRKFIQAATGRQSNGSDNTYIDAREARPRRASIDPIHVGRQPVGCRL